MAYYAPPGGSATARVASQLQQQSLHGLGIIPSINVRMPRGIQAAMGAARRRLIEEQATATMTGMGIVHARTPLHVPHYSTPAAVTFTAAARRAALSGLGARVIHSGASFAPFAAGAARSAAGTAASVGRAIASAAGANFEAFPNVRGVRRQAAPFAAPGGGYSQIPGFTPPPVTMRGLQFFGDDTIDTTMAPDDNTLIAPTVSPIALPSNAGTIWEAQNPELFHPVSTTMSPDVNTLQAPRTSPISLIPGAKPGSPVFYNPATGAVSLSPQQPFMKQSLVSGIPNQYLIGGAALVLLLGTMGGKRRRNPRRRRRNG